MRLYRVLRGESGKLWSFLLCIFFASLTTALASEPASDSVGPTFVVRAFEEEFPNRAVKSLVTDEEGFLWIGTFGAGLYRFDGVSFVPYTFDWGDSTSLASNFVEVVYPDSAHRLWIGTDKGLSVFDKKRQEFRRLTFKIAAQSEPLSKIAIRSLLMDAEGNFFVGTDGWGLLFVAAKDLLPQSDEPLLAQQFGKEFVFKDLVDVAGATLYAATNGGLLRFSYKFNELLAVGTVEHPCSQPTESLFLDSSGTLWVGTSYGGLLSVEISCSPLEYTQYPLTSNRILAITGHGVGGLVCATENDGLLLLDEERKARFVRTANLGMHVLESNSIWSLHRDEHNRLWLGYYDRGIGLHDESAFFFQYLQHIPNSENSLKSMSVNSMLMEGDSVLIIGMDGGGIDRYNLAQQTFEHLDEANAYIGLGNKSVQSLFRDTRGNLWVGTWGGGIFRLRPGQKKFEYLSANVATDTPIADRILGFAESKNGFIWIATFGHGLHYYDPVSGRIAQKADNSYGMHGIPSKDIRSVLVDSRNRLWIGSTKGLYAVDRPGEAGEKVHAFSEERYEQQFHPSFYHLLTIFEDDQHNIWLGTDGAGLYRYVRELDKFERIAANELLDQTTICAIAQSADKAIWISGKSGISRIQADGKAYRVSNFTKDEGLLSNNFNYGAIYFSQGNQLFLGSQAGVNYFSTDQETQRREPGQIFLSGLRIFNELVLPNSAGSPLAQALDFTEELVLRPHQSVFSIEYTTTTLSRSESVQFAYYLDGLETNWNYVGNKRMANYTSLTDGTYIFRVKAATKEGVWTGEERVLRIRILPPWYKSRLAYTAYIALLLLLSSLLYFFLRMRVRERQALVLAEVKQRQTEILNQQKIDFFTNISHEFRTPLALILNPLKDLLLNNKLNDAARRKLNIINRNAQRLERLANELLDFQKVNSNKLQLQAQQQDISRLAREVFDYFEEEASKKWITFDFEVANDIPLVWIDFSLVEKTVYNLLSNAFKFTPENGRILLKIDCIHHLFPGLNNQAIPAVRLQVRDTGPGIDEEELQHIFERFYQTKQSPKVYYGSTGIGLEMVKSFMQLHKGRVEVDSTLGEGTTFSLFFPLGDRHLLAEEKLPLANSQQAVKAAPPLALPAEDVAPSLAPAARTGLSVLIVEDNLELRDYLKEELAQSYKIFTAKDGKAGLEKALEVVPDLILSDVMMPQMDGLTLSKQLRANAATHHIPIILLSAKATDQDKLQGLIQGADIYINKPFDMQLLKVQMKQLLKSQQSILDKYLGQLGYELKEKALEREDRDFLLQCLQLINLHLPNPELSVEQLAENVHLSRSQLYRRVKQITGLSVNHLIRDLRLGKARELLLQTELNIGEIAYEVGFTSASYFTRCYKAHFGYLPLETRKWAESTELR